MSNEEINEQLVKWLTKNRLKKKILEDITGKTRSMIWKKFNNVHPWTDTEIKLLINHGAIKLV